MGLTTCIAHVAALVPVLTTAELEVLVRAMTSAQGLAMKVVDSEVVTSVATLLGGGALHTARKRRKTSNDPRQD